MTSPNATSSKAVNVGTSQWALNVLAATLGDTADAFEAVLWLAKDRDIEWEAAPKAVQRALDRAERWDADRRAVEAERVKCPRCGGGGTHPDHDRGCPGGGPICQAQCPVEVLCTLCRGEGSVTPEAARTKEPADDEPF